MGQASDAKVDSRRKPRLASSWDPSSCRLSPEEGFLLSRIDGHTPWSQLREIAGLPPEVVDRCLERWLSEGILTLANGALNPSEASAEHAKEASSPDFEADTDLSREEQRRIIDFEARLSRSYHELLGVERGADAKAIKRAYFSLSRKFHPDRHFRRELGSFGPRLEKIFMKLVEAYELLSDPATRAEIERSMSQAPPPEPAPDPTAGGNRSTAPRGDAATEADRAGVQPDAHPVNSKRATLERLRRHFRIPEKVMAERRFKARQFQQAALAASHRGNWIEAGASIRLAIAFDPWNDEYKRSFAEVQARVHQVRADELLAEADRSLDAHAQTKALHLLEEALNYRPSDAGLNARTAALADELGEADAAREYAQAACDFDPDNAGNHRLLGRILRGMGLIDKARAALERSLELEPASLATKLEIKSLNRRRASH